MLLSVVIGKFNVIIEHNLNVRMKQYATNWQDLNPILTKKSLQIIFILFYFICKSFVVIDEKCAC